MPTRHRTLDIVACVVYKPEKATRLLDLHLKDLVKELREDLIAMKMPQPPEVNIRSPSLEGMVFSWTTRRYSPLYTTICHVVDNQDDDTLGYKKTKAHCSIDKILVSEAPPTDFEKLKPSPTKRVTNSWLSRSQSDKIQIRKTADQQCESLATDFDQYVKGFEDACRAVTDNEESMPLSQETCQEPAAVINRRRPLSPITLVPASKAGPT